MSIAVGNATPEVSFKPSFFYTPGVMKLDYCPLASAIVTIFRAREKYFSASSAWDGTMLPAFQPLTREHRGYWRDILLLVPVIGNIIIYVYDVHAKNMAEEILKGVPEGTELNQEKVEALRQAAGYGNMEAIVRLAKFYITKAYPEKTDKHVGGAAYDIPWMMLVKNLYNEAADHGNSEAMMWVSKCEELFIRLVIMKRKMSFIEATNLVESYTPETDAGLNLFEEIHSFCLKNPDNDKMTLLRRLCDQSDKFKTNHDTAKIRQEIEQHV
jgi:hypothetical protein